MSKLYLYYFKKRLLSIIVVSFLAFAITFVYFQINDIVTVYDYPTLSIQVRNTGIGYLSTIMMILIPIYVMFEFSYKMKKNSIDLFYSLPIKRNKLILTKYLITLTETVIVFTISFLYIFFKVLVFKIKETYDFHMEYYFLYYLAAIICFTLLIGFFAFFYMRANTIVDGIIIMALSSIVLVSITSLISNTISYVGHFVEFDDSIYRFFNADLYLPFSPLMKISDIFNDLVIGNVLDEYTKYSLMSIIMFIIEGASVFFLFKYNDKIKAELTGDITNDLLCYKVMIPTIMLALLINKDLSWVLLVIIIIGAYILYVIKNHNFKIQKSELFTLIICSGIGVIAYILLNYFY